MKTKYSPAYAGKTRRRVRCQSGAMGERSRLQSRYADLDEFAMFDRVYNLTARLGYTCPKATANAWHENPVIESSVNPSDLRVVSP